MMLVVACSPQKQTKVKDAVITEKAVNTYHLQIRYSGSGEMRYEFRIGNSIKTGLGSNFTFKYDYNSAQQLSIKVIPENGPMFEKVF